MSGRAVALVVALWPVGAGCDLEPDVGGAAVARCENVDSNPDVDVSFRDDIVPLFVRDTAGCAMCHDPQGASPIGVTVGGLDLTSHARLMAGGARSATTIVIPGAPCDSVLVQKLKPGPPFGGRMPGNGPPFLVDSEIQRIHDWIAEGGLDN